MILMIWIYGIYFTVYSQFFFVCVLKLIKWNIVSIQKVDVHWAKSINEPKCIYFIGASFGFV